MCLRVLLVFQADLLTQGARKQNVFQGRHRCIANYEAHLQEMPLFWLQVKYVHPAQKASLQRQRPPKLSAPLVKPVSSAVRLEKSARPANLACTVVAVELTAATQPFVHLLVRVLQAVTAYLVPRRGSKRNALHAQLVNLATAAILVTAALVARLVSLQTTTEQRRANVLSVLAQAKLGAFPVHSANLAPERQLKPRVSHA